MKRNRFVTTALWTALATSTYALSLIPADSLRHSAIAAPTYAARSTQEAYPNFYTDETATPGVYLVSYVDGLGDGVREPEDDSQYEPAARSQ